MGSAEVIDAMWAAMEQAERAASEQDPLAKGRAWRTVYMKLGNIREDAIKLAEQLESVARRRPKPAPEKRHDAADLSGFVVGGNWNGV